LINLVQGTVSFVAAQVAKTGTMRVDTPTATLGIRVGVIDRWPHGCVHWAWRHIR
jgi:hypothetical protein